MAIPKNFIKKTSDTDMRSLIKKAVDRIRNSTPSNTGVWDGLLDELQVKFNELNAWAEDNKKYG